MTGQTSCGKLPERLSPTGISVLVVGAGIAGLMTALELWRKGNDVRIIERTASRVQSGDVLTIGSSGVRAFRRWPDMSEENDRISYEMWISWHKINGDLISGPAPFRPIYTPKNQDSDQYFEDELEPRPKIYRHRRHRVHKMLANQLERVGIEVEYGQRVVRYVEDVTRKKASVVLENDEKIEADLVIAADGIGSRSCSITLGREVRAKPTGVSMYRAMMPVEQAVADPTIAEKFPLLDEGRALNQMWMGEEVYALFGRTQEDMIWYLTYPDRGTSQESWSNLVSPETVLQTTSTIDGWPEFANRLIKATTKDQIHDFKLMWRDPESCWVSPGGRVVQVGDAAHTFLPSSGHGCTQGLEDAVSLATCLRIAGKEDLHWATRVHNKLRFERTSCLQLLGVLNHSLRNRSANADKSQTKPIGILGSWIWRHDPERYAIENYVKALAHVKDGPEFTNTNIPPGHSYRPWTIDEILNAKETGKAVELDGDWD